MAICQELSFFSRSPRETNRRGGISHDQQPRIAEIVDNHPLLFIIYTYTVGILAKALRLRYCDMNTADRYLAKMIGHGFYAPVTSIKEIFRR
jgi:hypothetical protein